MSTLWGIARTIFSCPGCAGAGGEATPRPKNLVKSDGMAGTAIEGSQSGVAVNKARTGKQDCSQVRGLRRTFGLGCPTSVLAHQGDLDVTAAR